MSIRLDTILHCEKVISIHPEVALGPPRYTSRRFKKNETRGAEQTGDKTNRHELLFIIVRFIFERGDLWPWSTARLEARGARAKVVARSVINWAKSGVRNRSINKRERTKGKKALRGGPERGSTPFTQAYNSSGVQQLLGAQGLREQMLRTGKIAPKKSNRLGRLGRTTAPRQTKKWEEDWSTLKALSCRKAFELCLRNRIPRFYDVRGVRGDWNAAVRYLEQASAGAS